MTSRIRVFLAGVVACAALLAASTDTALAAAGDFGRNVGDQVHGLAVGLFLAVAGLVALPILGRRDVNGGIVLAVLVIVLGGFIFAQGTVRQVIVGLWHALVA